MDWNLAIKRNCSALKGIIDVLFALLGLDGTDADSRIPRSLHSAVLRVLRPAESAIRRLIVIAARNVVVRLAPSRPVAEGHKIVKGAGSRPPAFQIFDPRKRFKPVRALKFTRLAPRIHFFPHDPRIQHCFQHPGLWLNPRRPMAGSMQHASTRGSRPSNSRSMFCPAKRGDSRAGSRGERHRRVSSPPHRSDPAIHRVTAENPFSRLIKFSSNATASLGKR